MKIPFKLNKQFLLIVFGYLVVTLLLIKTCEDENITVVSQGTMTKGRIGRHAAKVDSMLLRERAELVLFDSLGNPVRNRVTSVRSFQKSFPDLNDVQLATARHIGVDNMRDRKHAKTRRSGLVFIADNPFYAVRPLSHSIPYLTPRASTLLNVIGRAFMDSLATKGLPMHKIEVTSVLRTDSDIKKLRRVNHNASKNSCHRFGTTFDIAYNKFIRIQPSSHDNLPMTNAVQLKSVLAEVLEDLRLSGACYVKYEQKQACFHITAR